MGISLALAVVAKAVAVGLGLDRTRSTCCRWRPCRSSAGCSARSSCWPPRWALTGGCRALRLGPRQRDRAAGVDARRRAHAARRCTWPRSCSGIPVADAGRRRSCWSSRRSAVPGRRLAVVDRGAAAHRARVGAGAAGGRLRQRRRRRRRSRSRFARFDALPALLVLVPAHLSSSGALGGILSGRLSSKLFLGLVEPPTRPEPRGPARHLPGLPAGRARVRVQRRRAPTCVGRAAGRGQPRAGGRWWPCR